MMKTVSKKAFTAVIACMLACVMFVTPVFAATNYFSKTTVKLNAYNGGSSTKSTVSSGSVSGTDRSITSVSLYCNVSSGTDPYTLYVLSPSGKQYSVSGPTSSTTLTTTAFNGEDPNGTWTIWIVNSGYTTHGNIYPVSTVTVTLKVYYSY